ncbi:MAG: hypothetical protein CBARDMAM_6751 [uncultured Caballeronia sp.]|nr:MAG: hypothetical protein CBARDMAM_6751 [uncultured Caballeronia sp.]
MLSARKEGVRARKQFLDGPNEMGGKSGRNEREATRVESIIAGLASWRRGWYQPKVEAVKKGASYVANRWRLSAEDHALPVRVVGVADTFRIERTPGLVTPWVFTTSAPAATPTGPPRLRQRTRPARRTGDYAGSFIVGTAADGAGTRRPSPRVQADHA